MRSGFAVYPGSFDPLTNGHMDILRRALSVFDEVRVAVAYNQEKPSGLFTPPERVTMIQEVVREEFGSHVSADAFHGLLTEYCRSIGAGTIVRGLRAVADFEYEFQMTMMNRHLAPDVETVFLMAGEQHFYTSSRLVKEVASLGGDVHGLVPDIVEPHLLARVGRG
ncbi:MAG TPA: pantetheine-phosphate adenylyltransferase [Candidatus Binatia bacterium]|jgi:pantetheine-phosphate adenylyltransferase